MAKNRSEASASRYNATMNYSPSRRVLEAAFSLLTAVSFVGCDSGELKKLVPDKLTLYSIDGRSYPNEVPKMYADNEKIHGFPVLGKLDVKDETVRQEIMTALRNGIGKDDGTRSGCFWPRHAIRTIEGGKTTDYVVCFQCERVFIVSDDEKETLPISETPKATFNKHLKAAGVPLAPED